MSWKRNSVFLLHAYFLMVQIASAEQIMCPSYKEGRKLRWFGVYDGYISKMADMEGGDNGWPVIYPGAYKEGYFVKCTYDENGLSKNYIAMPILKTLTHCRTAVVDGVATVACR